MKKFIILFLKLVLILIIMVALYLGGVILYGTITDYQPPLIEKIEPQGSFTVLDTNKSGFSFLTWNMGYGGLGKEMDFFYDGGKMVRPGKKLVSRYLQGISGFLAANDTIDFICINEIDLDSRRSYRTKQTDTLSKVLATHGYLYANNYVSRYVPVPFTEPMGKVLAGLALYSKYYPTEAMRYAFVANYAWPKKLFMLDRCFILARYPLKNNRSLVVINTHNEAFDNGSIRKAQMAVLKDKMLEEYKKGNYVVVGGDWNQNPVGFDKNAIRGDIAEDVMPPIEKEFLPSGWQWVFDPLVSTNRSNVKPFVRGENKTTLIDFFVISPNLSVKSIKTIDLGYENSDHNPVIMNVSLNEQQD